MTDKQEKIDEALRKLDPDYVNCTHNWVLVGTEDGHTLLECTLCGVETVKYNF